MSRLRAVAGPVGMTARAWCRCVILFALPLQVVHLAAMEPAETMQSATERALEVPAGPWQGEWTVVREDPLIRTRAGAEALRLSIVHDAGSDRAQVHWNAGRAICDDVMAEPCEWIGAEGQVDRAVVAPTGLYLRIPVSADESAPFLLHLSRPVQGAMGVLFDDGVRYRVALATEDAWRR